MLGTLPRQSEHYRYDCFLLMFAVQISSFVKLFQEGNISLAQHFLEAGGASMFWLGPMTTFRQIVPAFSRLARE